MHIALAGIQPESVRLAAVAIVADVYGPANVDSAPPDAKWTAERHARAAAAALHADAAALRAEVARLTGERDEARAGWDAEARKGNPHNAVVIRTLQSQLAAAEAESERLREALEDIAKWGGQLNVTHDGKVCARKAAAALRGATP